MVTSIAVQNVSGSASSAGITVLVSCAVSNDDWVTIAALGIIVVSTSGALSGTGEDTTVGESGWVSVTGIGQQVVVAGTSGASGC